LVGHYPLRPEAMEEIVKSWTPVTRCFLSPMAVLEVRPIHHHVVHLPLALPAGHLTQTL
jgi:hypothetical protein